MVQLRADVAMPPMAPACKIYADDRGRKIFLNSAPELGEKGCGGTAELGEKDCGDAAELGQKGRGGTRSCKAATRKPPVHCGLGPRPSTSLTQFQFQFQLIHPCECV